MKVLLIHLNKRRLLPLIHFIALFIVGFFLFIFQNKSNATVMVLDKWDNEIQIPIIKHFSSKKNIQTYVVKKGDSFYSIFPKFGIGTILIDKMFFSLKNIGFLSIYPDDSIVIRKNQETKSISVDLFIKTIKYSVTFEDSLFSVATEKIRYDRCIYVLNEVIKNSLSESIFSAGVGDAITSSLTEVFSWDINFFLDPRIGDCFQIVFEKIL